ncbi:MAG: alcohol dehydrogenase [Chloroflexi bacterium]|nr:alcohol dehydrogenase [Chloroflexota bacterium]|tara:strand:+ start:2010 stop:2948 length:939 start_codon:yes stop_codon:yes gene_type:complete
MYEIKQPSNIIMGKNSCSEFRFDDNCLIITSQGAKARGWLEYLGIKNFLIYDKVESNPPIEICQDIIDEFSKSKISNIIGLGGGSSMDVAKYVGYNMKKNKILIPTTFGSGSEVTRISVLTVNGEKTSFHNDGMFADIAIIDPYFIKDTPRNILKNSAVDACAQCSEGYDSKSGNIYTKFLCKKAFDILEDAILNEKYENLPKGALITGLGFGNCSTTLGHALSYVYSNEGYSHGHALAFTTRVAHEFNSSIFTERFSNIVNKLKFEKITLEQDLEDAADIILKDSKHLMNNPHTVEKNDIINLLTKINNFD